MGAKSRQCLNGLRVQKTARAGKHHDNRLATLAKGALSSSSRLLDSKPIQGPSRYPGLCRCPILVLFLRARAALCDSGVAARPRNRSASRIVQNLASTRFCNVMVRLNDSSTRLLRSQRSRRSLGIPTARLRR